MRTAPSNELRANRAYLRRPGRKVATVAAFLALTAACTSETPASSAPETHAPTTHAPATPGPEATSPRPTAKPIEAEPAQAACTLPNGTQEVTKRTSNGAVHLSSLIGTEVRLGMHNTNGDCYESVVFEFEGKAPSREWPGVHARNVEGPIKAEPSDMPIRILGNKFLQITIGAPMYAQGGGSGPSRVSGPSEGPVKEVVLTENFEGMSTWTVGLDEARKFTVSDVSGTANCPDLCVAVNIQSS
jgi:hypothetical protein